MEAAGDCIGSVWERAQADQLERDASWALDPVLHATGRMAVGNGDEIALGSEQMRPFVDTVREQPDMLAADASRQRMELADNANALQSGWVWTRQPRSGRRTTWKRCSRINLPLRTLGRWSWRPRHANSHGPSNAPTITISI